MNRQFDEYQKIQRYRNGYYLFFVLVFLILFNNSLSISWGYTVQIENLFLLHIVLMFFHIISIFTYSYFGRKEKEWPGAITVFISGIFQVWIINQPSETDPATVIYANGKIGYGAVSWAFALTLLLTPFLLGTRNLLDRIREQRE